MTDRRQQTDKVLSGKNILPLEAVVCTGELARRPARVPDYANENRALVKLAQALADSPRSILQTLADTILESFKAGSAGVSLLTQDEKNFIWPAIAGAWQPHIGGGTPRDFGPCGDALDCKAPLLFKHFERRYAYFAPVTPLIEECLLVPFYVEGKAVGTIWAITHDQHHKFDAEDLRQLESLGRFASAAYQTVKSWDAVAQRRIAVNLMDNADLSHQAMEKLNTKLRASEERTRALFERGHENEWRLRYAMESARLTYVEVDFARGRAWTAENYARVMGYRPPPEQEADVAAGTRVLLEHVVPPDRQRLETAIRQFTGGEPAGKIEFRVLGDDGIERWIESRWSVQLGPDGKPLKSFATNLDITERKQVLEALQTSSERARLALDSAELGTFNIDPATNIMTTDERFRTIFGFAGECIDHNQAIVAIHVDDRAQVLDAMAAATRPDDPVPYSVEYRVVHLDGTVRWVFAKARINFIQSGAVRKLATFDGTVTDITKRKQAEQQLRNNHDTFFKLIENAPFGVYVVDAQFRLRQVSSGSQRVFSNVRPLIGRDFEEVIRTIWAEPFASAAIAHFRHTLKTGEPFVAPNSQQPRGDIADAESYDWRIERITLPDGQFGVVCYFYDLTERMQAEDALRRSEAFNRSIIDSSPDCIKVLDLDGNLLAMHNGQKLLGIEDIRPYLNKSWIEFWKGGDRQAAEAAAAMAARGREGKFVGFFRTLHGEPRWWEVSVSPILNADGKPARLLAISRDVTQRRQAEMNLEFLASISQDLVSWTNVEEMTRTIGAKMAAYLQLSLCAFVEINEAAEEVVIFHDWHRPDVPGLVGFHRLADFVGAEFIRMARAGQIIVVRDTGTDSRTGPEQFAALKIASFICVPLVRDGRWCFSLCFYHSEPYDWREDEIELARELTARIWTRLERLRAEEALRVSELRYRTLFESMEDGFCIIEQVAGAAGAPPNFLYIEANPAFGTQSGENDVVGKTTRDVFPDITEDWYRTYMTLIRTGEPIRFEQIIVSRTQATRVLELNAVRVEQEGRLRIAIVFKDITARRQAKEALRQRTAQFEALLNQAPVGVYLIDGDFRLRHVNPTALPAFGDIPDLIGRNLDDVLHILWTGAKADEIAQRFRHTLETGESCIVAEEAEPRADRAGIEYYEWQIHRIPLPEGGNGVVCYFRDISERVLAQNKIRDSEERYRTLFNSIDEGFCVIEVIFDKDEKPVDYRFLEVNPSFEKQSGLRGAAGKRMLELIPYFEASWFEIYGKVALTGEPVRFVNDSKTLNGRWFDVYAFRVGEPASRKIAIIFTNITERINANDELRESESRFRILFDRGPIGMYSSNVTGAIKECNGVAAHLWGRAPKSGESDEQFRFGYSFYLPDGTFLPFADTPMSKVLRGEIPLADNFEIVIGRPDGSRINVIANIIPLKNTQGEITGVLNCFYDITERSRLTRTTQEQAKALVEVDRRKDEFLAMLSHELRNPLAPIANALQLLRLQKNENPLQQQAHSIIERQVGQLNHLVDDLLEISRITTGRVQLRQEQIVLSSIVERAVETARPYIKHHRHELTVSMPPQPVWVYADAARLEQVVVNLLTNAAKYTGVGGNIGLTVQLEGGAPVLRVRDTGIGIAPELLPHIFDLFTQAQRSLDRSQGGLGIGLCLVQRLVELHGGTVEVYSVLGQGSEFVVRLPMMLTSMLPSPPPAVETVRTSGKFCRVLVVDDNVDAAQSLAMLLEISGHEARMAYDGPTALAAAIDYQPDMVLLDIGLPDLDGYEVAKRIRQEPELKNIVLVAMTGYGRETDRQRSQEAGFDHHLVKPADFGKLQKILASVSEKMTVMPAER